MSRRLRLNQKLFELPLTRRLGQSIYSKRVVNQQRSQSCATKFFRNMEQLNAIKEPLAELVKSGRQLRVLVAGCSYGCEAYSLAGYLATEFPQLDWVIDAIDISPEAVAIAQAARFGREHGLGSRCDPRTSRIAKFLFNRCGDQWTVVPDVRMRVRVEQADVLGADFSKYRGFDLVFAQNFLVHMDDKSAAEAFARLAAAVKPDGALFAGGMHLAAKARLARQNGLHPLNWRLKEIHDEDEMRRQAWPWHYWALEPLDRREPDFIARYSTIFLKPAGVS